MNRLDSRGLRDLAEFTANKLGSHILNHRSLRRAQNVDPGPVNGDRESIHYSASLRRVHEAPRVARSSAHATERRRQSEHRQLRWWQRSRIPWPGYARLQLVVQFQDAKRREAFLPSRSSLPIPTPTITRAASTTSIRRTTHTSTRHESTSRRFRLAAPALAAVCKTRSSTTRSPSTGFAAAKRATTSVPYIDMPHDGKCVTQSCRSRRIANSCDTFTDEWHIDECRSSAKTDEDK